MHDYLRACFPDFRHNPKIGGSIKNFIFDCGIASVNAAIEFKIAHTEQQAIAAFTGVVEDVGGYKGSKEWDSILCGDVPGEAIHFRKANLTAI